LTVILNYGINNLRSVEKAISFLGHQCRIQTQIEGATKLILPGVGAFGAAMERIRPIAKDIRQFADAGNPVLGICLGQQLLFESSEEFGSHEGLGLIPGRVVYFNKDMGLKIPHVGWSTVSFGKDAALGNGLCVGERVYFVHSLHTVCRDSEDVASKTTYGIAFTSSVQRGNVFGTQFHPEKSGDVGLRILRNFLEC
jgi:glutamine amidotransferase